MKKLFLFLFFDFVSATIGFCQPSRVSQAFYLYDFLAENSTSLQLKHASSLSVDPAGFIYVADRDNNRILKFSNDGKLIKSIGGFGWEKEQFYTPLDICATSALDIFVADYNNNRIQRYDKDLNYIFSWSADENWDKQFDFGFPKSVQVSIHGDLFFLDGENVRLLKINSFGEPELSFGDYSEGKGRLEDPIQLAISPLDRIFVSDRQANKIGVFDYFGNYLTEIGVGLLKQPTGIFYSRSNELFVADTGNLRVVIFSADGEFIFSWAQISKNKGTFTLPQDVITIDSHVYVLDNDHIFVFELK